MSTHRDERDVIVAALRALLRATTGEEVAAAVARAVRELGGTLVPPVGGLDELPVDVTFGSAEPLVPTGDPPTLAVLRAVLPALVDDAHVALDRTRRESHLAESALTDPLTGLANRRVAMRVLGRLRDGDSVVVVDLDHFKQINDTSGHAAGDTVLRAFAATLRGVVRASDTAARFGGEEFLLLLPRTDVAGAVELLDRVRATWETTRPAPVTFSAGIAAVDGDPAAALASADEALYRAKAAGRNRVEAADG